MCIETKKRLADIQHVQVCASACSLILVLVYAAAIAKGDTVICVQTFTAANDIID
jgi:hypothetical protein